MTTWMSRVLVLFFVLFTVLLDSALAQHTATIAPRKWQQTGKTKFTVPLQYIDFTENPVWTPYILEALARVSALRSPFVFNYRRATESDNLIPEEGTIKIVDGVRGRGNFSWLFWQGNSIKAFQIHLDDYPFQELINQGIPADLIHRLRRKTLGHEVLHTWGLDHHFQIIDGQAWLQPSIMGSGEEITQWEQGQICSLYRCP